MLDPTLRRARPERPRSRRRSVAWAALRLWVLGGLSVSAAPATAPSASDLEFFENRIRPALVSECYECHGAQKQKGGLRLDSRDGLIRGGDSGRVLVPGDANQSLLIQSLRHERPEPRMPKDRPPLASGVIADFVTWVNQGAVDPRDQPPSVEGQRSASWETTRKAREDWWSFKPPTKPVVPSVNHATWSQHPVDRFLLAKMAEHGLEPAPPAGRESLLRRASFALTGLPPTPAEVESFLRDPAPDAYERRIDAMLLSPRFGERWARHWMDLVRYSESHGSQGDPELPFAWRYRDYLIRAFNHDVPYDQLVREHIAGDLLPDPRINHDEGLNESRIGPAHLRMVEYGYIPVDALDDQVKVVDNQIDVFSKAFLGLTVSCARCHDHKFDPISQKDFHALYGIFASSRPGQVVVDVPSLSRTNRGELAALKQEIRRGLAEAWSAAAAAVGKKLRDEAEHRREKAGLDAAVLRLSRELAAVESRARTELTASQKSARPSDLPVPMAQWSFEGDLLDGAGGMHARAEGGAVVREGRLVLNGTNAWVVTEPLPTTLKEKTLEVWVTLAGLEQKGGGALTVQTPDSEIFDSIVFGEQERARWMAGSDFFRRTRNVDGPAETAQPDELVHIAIAYASDNSITLYRNGVPYGVRYAQGSLQAFQGGSARVVLGKRHLGVGVTAFAGEIEEARIYPRALSAREIASSFQAGVLRIEEAALARALTPEEREKRQGILKELHQLEEARRRLAETRTLTEAWSTALTEAAVNVSHPLHPWAKLSASAAAGHKEGWEELAGYWKRELAARREFNRTNFSRAWDLRGEPANDWFRADAPNGRASPATGGDFVVEVQGDRVLRGLRPAGVFSHALTLKDSGVLSSPRFRIGTDNISVLALGDRSTARVVIENYAIGGGGIYPASGLGSDEMRWVRMDTAYRKGANAYLEFITTDDSPMSGSRPEGRAYFGVAEVVFHNGPEPPREAWIPAAFVLSGEAPVSVGDLSERYGRLLEAAITRWREGTLGDEELAFLDSFVRRGLLPVTLADLPRLAGAVAAYRAREAAIPVPRRAPGVHEAVGFDQPLFVRGQITQLGDPVPRGFLQMFHSRGFPTTRSGRLELAAAVTDSGNPLVARVMVNRIWHHVFGRGLVGTVDNFGRLGDKPTHPELLDHLATRFVEEGWSVKKIIRYLMTSQAYQQSALPTAAARKVDAGNELLSHARVRRLDAEAIRDAVLAVSGQLDLTLYGRGVNVYFVAKTEGGGPKGPLDGDRRRSLYQSIRRNAANPFLEAFDTPKPMSTRGKRDVTNVPAQSLTMLNDPFLIDQAAKWAKALVAEGHNRTDRVGRMFLRALGRSATTEEREGAQAFLEELAAAHGVPPAQVEANERIWQDFAQSLFCLKEFIYVD